MQLVAGAEHDLHLLHRAPVAREDVVHPGAHEAAAQLGEGPAQLGALADVRAALLEHDMVGSQLLEAGHRKPGMGAQPDLGRRGQQGLGARPDVVGRDELLDHRCLRAVPQNDQRPADEGPRCPEHPAQHDGLLETDARGDVDDDPMGPRSAGELGELLAHGDGARLEELTGERRVIGDQVAQRLQPDAGRAGRLAESQRGDAILPDLDQPGDLRGDGTGNRRMPRSSVRQGVVEGGRTEVHVGRVQPAALDRQRLERLEGREAVGAKPVRVGARRDDRLDERTVDERERQVGRGTPRGARRPAGHGRRVGDLRHPRDPSISSLTSRLNSIAYSIGSSLVNTSRKPCTMRFVASFSVSPRLIR